MYQVTDETINTSYICKREGIIVQGTHVKNSVSGEIQSVNGTCYRPNEKGETGENFGNFNGYPRGGELKFSLSEMTRSDSNLTWGAIDEIESEILAAGE